MTPIQTLGGSVAALLALAACGNGDDTAAQTGASGETTLSDRTQGMDNEAVVNVEVTNVEPGAGPIYVALQDTASFARSGGAHTAIADATGTEVIVPLEDVEPGRWAVAVFQDINRDGEMSLGGGNWPQEPYGFSGPPQAGQPMYDIAAVEITGEGDRVPVQLRPPLTEDPDTEEMSLPNAYDNNEDY